MGRLRAYVAVAAVLCLMLGAVSFGAAAPGDRVNLQLDAGTRTATWVEQRTYDWTIEKTVNPASLTVARGETEPVQYTITATRNEVGTATEFHQVCVTVELENKGTASTTGLQLILEVSYSVPTWGVIATETLTPTTQLARKSKQTYTVCTQFELQAGGGEYRAKVIATDTTGASAETTGNEKFVPATTLTPQYVDGSASVSDLLNVPSGLTAAYAAGVTFPRTFTATGSYPYTVNITNVSAAYEATLTVGNTGTLTESTSLVARSDNAAVSVYTGVLTGEPPPPGDGCVVHSQGYWRNHVELWPSGDYDDFFGIGMSWLDVLKTAPKGDAWYIYAHQWIAAYLNMHLPENAECDPPDCVVEAYEAGFDFFEDNEPGVLMGGKLSEIEKELREQILEWAHCLDLWNTGESCSAGSQAAKTGTGLERALQNVTGNPGRAAEVIQKLIDGESPSNKPAVPPGKTK